MKRNILTEKIEKLISREVNPRDYIGASIIGSDCLRQIWYEFKGTEAKEFPSKMQRTWDIGKHLEKLILYWLSECGIEIATDYWDLESEEMPFFKGHLDAVWMQDGKPFAIIEIKTAKDASFNVFLKKGLIAWNAQYYAQIQSYMGMSGIHITYIIVLNKDNSELCDEEVTFDDGFYQQLRRKAFLIANIEAPPSKINESPIFFKCKMCKFNKICHQ